MAEEIDKPEEPKSVIDQAQALAGDAAEEAKSLLSRAQEAIGDAVEATIDAVKASPITAAGIAAGAAVTVAGVAYGASKLIGSDEDDKKTTKPKPKA
ncbi:hypothetical protein [uncultured Sphingomonas sp.]|uniref:hypothetical protein n=1 Tax=uncultured Sphingomonas sp. TaxID=158754 RepID=UPI0035CBAF27